ncbi:MAG: dethiobiotin synthase [Myxococcales bacterium]|nr:dethiobiotin synthase [Myxococcales bacterium]MCB9531965.1 dethiobiotin synthase [Myxococcales bacterium]MCB9532822.1 dethiobiotin synthase [Myxococcales bacterium]
MPPRRIVLVGTDTGVGKTWVATRLITALRRRGLTVGALKPLESGCGSDDGELVPADAVALASAAGIDDPSRVCPWALPRPVAPAAELVRVGLHVSAAELVGAAAAAEEGADVLVVETAGGVLSPLTPSLTSADLASLYGGLAVLVAPDRLGVISHVATALESLRARDVSVAAVALNRMSPVEPAVAESTREWLRRGCPETRLVEVGPDVDELVAALL